MTTDQLSLLQGDALAQHRFVCCALLEDALRICRSALIDSRPASEHEVERALLLIRELAAELTALPGEEPVPF